MYPRAGNALGCVNERKDEGREAWLERRVKNSPDVEISPRNLA